MAEKHVDEVSGIETTGHVWDGDLRELNKPLPKWWLYVFYVSIIWSIGYWIVYPAWPTLNGYTKGIWGYSQRQTVTDEFAAAKARQTKFVEGIKATPLADIQKKPDLFAFARAGGAAAFGDNCAPCHGRGAAGTVGYPNLNDDDWIWGGRLADIEKTLLHGIRSTHASTRISDMPKFGVDKLLKDSEISDVAEYVLSLSRRSTDAAAVPRGEKVFAQQCASCHGKDGKGMQQQGGPNLTDGIWLYGGRRADIVESIRTGRGGVMPHWEGRLDPVTIKMLTVYVHSLGGGVK